MTDTTARRYSTAPRHATVNTHILTENGARDLHAGQRVTVRLRCTAYNALRRREEFVYTVTVDGAVWGDLYGSNLTIAEESNR